MLVDTRRRAPNDPRRPSRLGRVARIAVRIVGILVAGVLGLVALVLLLLDTAPVRAFAAREVTALLEPQFQGRIRIDRIGRLGLFGIAGVDATLDDPAGKPVLVAHGVSADVDTLGAVRSLLFGKKAPLTVRLLSVDVESADVRLDADAQGGLLLGDAFASKTPPSPPDPNARGFRLDLEHIGLGHAGVHGAPPGAPALDADVDGLAGSFSLTPDYLEGDLVSAALTARKLVSQADVSGLLVAHVKRMSAPPWALSGSATWAGLAGGVPHSMKATLDGDRIEALVDAPRADPAAVRTLWPSSTLDAPASLHAEAHGTLPRIAFAVRAGLGEGALDVQGDAVVGETKTVRAHIEARRVDLHDLGPTLPSSRLTLLGDAAATSKSGGALDARLDARLAGGWITGADVPPVALAGTMNRTSEGAMHARATVTVDAAYAPTRIEASMEPEGNAAKVDVDVDSRAPELGAVPQLAHLVQGSLELQARATLHTGPMTVDADVHARGQHLVQGTTRIASASVLAHASGPVNDPEVDASASAQGLAVAGRHLASAHVTVLGPATAPRVTASVRASDLPDLDASGNVVLAGGTSVHDVRLMLAGEGERAVGTVRALSLGDGGVRVDGLRVEGLGSPLEADLALSSAGARVRAATQGISLERIGHLAHMEKVIRGGMLAFDTDLHGKGVGWKGRATLDLQDASVDSWNHASAHADLDVDGRKVKGKIHADAADIGSVDVDVPSLDVGGFAPSSWRRAFGELQVDARGDLGKLVAAMPPDAVPFSEAKGNIELHAHVTRRDAGGPPPTVTFTLATDGLTLAPRIDRTRDIPGTHILEHPAWRIEGVDVDVDTTMEGASGKLAFDARAHDKRGDLAHVQATSDRFPYADVYGSTSRLVADLARTPLDVRVTIPRRGLGSLPNALKQTYLTGRLEGSVAFRGTLLAPSLDVDAKLGHSRLVRGAREEFLDFALRAHYDGAKATASLKANAQDKVLLDAEVDVEAAIAALLRDAESAPWKASMKAHFDAFPLEAIPVLDDRLVSGRMNGDLQIADVHVNGRANAALSVDGLKVGRVSYSAAKAKFGADGHALDADVRLEQSDGFLQARANGVTRWGAAVAPSLDPASPLQAELSSKHFRVSVLMPFVEGVLDELDGWLDADARIELDPRNRGTKLSGSVALSKGILEAAAGGGELHDLDARIRMQPDGTITLEKLSASGLSGRVDATGGAKLDGLRLVSANAVVVIPSSAPLPISASGAEIGNVDGRFELAATSAPAGGPFTLKIDIPHVRVALPSGNTNSAQALGPMTPGIRVGARRGVPATFVLVPEDPRPEEDSRASGSSGGLHVETNIADAQIVRGTDLKVDMTGKVEVMPGPSAKVTGQIRLKHGGTLMVQGHEFVVENGTVTMNPGDASNPEIVVRASWKAPEGSVVLVNFRGPLKTGKVTLSSEPPYSQQEIVALLTSGSPEGAQTQTPGADPTSAAISTVGGQATQPLNHMLGQLGLTAVSVKIDSTQASAPRPEVEVQIARDISVQLAVVLGQPPPGVNPDLTLVTLDWRFASRWSLASTVGDQGTTIFDLLWRTRY